MKRRKGHIADIDKLWLSPADKNILNFLEDRRNEYLKVMNKLGQGDIGLRILYRNKLDELETIIDFIQKELA